MFVSTATEKGNGLLKSYIASDISLAFIIDRMSQNI